MKWKKSPIDKNLVMQIATRYNISLLEASVFVRRGITDAKDMLFFLEKDFIHLFQPFLFRHMEMAVDRIKEAKEAHEKIFVYGDKDVDGITSTAILVRTFNELGIETLWRVPLGILGYGLSKKDVEYAHEEGVTLIVTVDCGISSVEEVVYANELGIDVIILDHHMPSHTLPDAIAIIDAKVKDETYPFDGLCAAAVAQKVRLALAISETPVYNVDQVLLNIVPIDGGYKFDVLCIRNFVVRWKKEFTMSSDNVEFQLEDFQRAIEGKQVIVYDKKVQVQLLQQIVGSVDLYSEDLQVSVHKYFSPLQNQSLLQIGVSARVSRYLDTETSEMDTFFRLYKAVMYREFPQLKQTFYEVSDLVVIATIADMMPLHGENRIFYKIGIEKLNSHANANLSCLLENLKLSSSATSIDSRTIGWKIAPVINSSGRMGEANLAVQMLLTTDLQEAYDRSTDLISLNNQRKKQMNNVKHQIRDEVEQSLAQYKKFVFIYNELLPHSFTGIVAGQYSRQYGVPVVIAARRGEEEISGSIRCPAVFDAPAIILSLESYLIDGGGHKAAAGFSLQNRNKESFFEELEEKLIASAEAIDEQENVNSTYVDLEIPHKYFDPKKIKNIQTALEPYGEAWSAINILFSDLNILTCEYVGRGNEHIKLIVEIGAYKVPAFVWQYKDMGGSFDEFKEAKKISVVSNTKHEIFQGLEQFSLIVQDWNIEE